MIAKPSRRPLSPNSEGFPLGLPAAHSPEGAWMPASSLMGSGMETKTRAKDASEFYLTLTPAFTAPFRASEAVMGRFGNLEEETRRDLAAVVAELVTNALAHGRGGPIAVAIAVGADTIRGEVSHQGELDPFEIPLRD
jgi:hypothetical protein